MLDESNIQILKSFLIKIKKIIINFLNIFEYSMKNNFYTYIF